VEGHRSTGEDPLDATTLPVLFPSLCIDFNFEDDALKDTIAEPHPTPPLPTKKNNMLPHMAIEGVLIRQKCAEKWCATLWDPRAPDLVAPNGEIFKFHNVRHVWKVAS